MVHGNTDRTNYLSLALDARKTINSLLKASETGEQSRELKEAITDTVESLRALSTGDLLFANLRPQFLYQYSEQVKTLEEVDSEMKDANVADKLSALNQPVSAEEKREIFKFAMAFFSALENRALQRYSNSASAALGR